MKRRTVTIVVLIATMVLCGTAARAANRFRYPEAKHGKGELRYVNGLPVLLVQGSPAEIGDQVGTLALKPGQRCTQTEVRPNAQPFNDVCVT